MVNFITYVAIVPFPPCECSFIWYKLDSTFIDFSNYIYIYIHTNAEHVPAPRKSWFLLRFRCGFHRAAALPQDYGGDSVQMKLSHGPFAPFLLFLIEWMDYSCTDSVPSFLGLLQILVYKVRLNLIQFRLFPVAVL